MATTNDPSECVTIASRARESRPSKFEAEELGSTDVSPNIGMSSPIIGISSNTARFPFSLISYSLQFLLSNDFLKQSQTGFV